MVCKARLTRGFLGVWIRQKKEEVVMSQRNYSRGIREVARWKFRGERELSENEQSIYQLMIGQLNWLVQYTRSDLAVGVSLASKKLQGANTTDMRKLIELVERAKDRMLEVNTGSANGGILGCISWEYGRRKITEYMIGLRDRKGERCPLA